MKIISITVLRERLGVKDFAMIYGLGDDGLVYQYNADDTWVEFDSSEPLDMV